MALAFDATSGANGTGDLSFTHTPVGTPKGVVVFVNQLVATTSEIVSVTYGGVTMTEVTNSPFQKTLGDEDGLLQAFFLGSSIPTGAQTVVVDVNATGSGKRAQVVTVTAAADTSVDATAGQDFTTTTAPTVNLSTSTTTFVTGSCHSGVDAVTAIAEGTGYTLISEFDHGAQCHSFIYRTANPSAGTVSVDWTQNLNDAAVFAVAVKEAAGGNPPVDLTADTGTGTAAGTASALTAGYTAATGTSTATGGTNALTVVLTASGGTASAAGGSVSLGGAVNLSAVTGSATASGGTVSLTSAYTASAGVAAAGGSGSTLSWSYTSTTGTAAASGGSVTRVNPAANGLANATGGASLVSFTFTASTGTATASGGTSTASSAVARPRWLASTDSRWPADTDSRWPLTASDRWNMN